MGWGRATASLCSGGIGKHRLADSFELAKIDPSRVNAGDDLWEHPFESARMRQGSCLHDSDYQVPDGKRLVLTNISGNLALPSGQVPYVLSVWTMDAVSLNGL